MLDADAATAIVERGEPQGSVSPRPALRGISLLTAIFDELSTHLGDDFSTAELMQAAQSLIDLSKQEYLVKHEQERGPRATFYSIDLATAFDSNSLPWRIARSDTTRLSHCDFDEFTPETFQTAKLVLQGTHERLWEF